MQHHIEPLFRLYDLGQVLSSKQAAHGASNAVYFVTTDQGEYVAIFYHPDRARMLPSLLQLQQQLLFAGIQTTQAITTKDHKIVHQFEHQPVVVYEFLAGHHSHQTSEELYQAGAKLAQLHNLEVDIRPHRPNPIDSSLLRQWLKQLSGELATERVAQANTLIDRFEALYKLPLPLGFIHADWFMDNAIISPQDIAMIDWELSCHDLKLYDLAIALNDWAVVEGQPNRQLEMAFLEGYQTNRPLTFDEQDHLPLARQYACIRFYLSRKMLAYDQAQLVKDPEAMWQLLQRLSN